ncbi:hypothetical protein DPMN_039771 [Dreissena polymorpha]|uniref:Uncharacterized protein n=1 Tax=Dreissena polymorpha TaxID=45954 RepID=A0A9D4HSG6_DREPO|nr:hypothetical protein DPMN_039771 [Dreissena polymorpha]
MEISSTMTRLGYSEEIRRWRVEKYKEHDRLANSRSNVVFRQLNSRVTHITAGSKTDGLTCCFESDWDVLFVLDDVLCVESDINLHTIPDDINVFLMDTRVYPGHCKLFLERPAPICHAEIFNASCDNGYGDVLLSSSLFLDEYSASLIAHSTVMHRDQ